MQAGLGRSLEHGSWGPGASRTPGKSSDLHAPALEHPPAGAKVALGSPSLARLQVSTQRLGPGRQRPFARRFRPRWCFPVVAGLWGGWAEAQDPSVPRGPWPDHLLPAQTAPGGLRPPEAGGAQGHPAAGRGGGRAGEGSWDRPGPPVPVANPSSRITPRHVGREWNKRRPPGPPNPAPPSSPPAGPPAPPPRAQLTSRGRSHDEGQCQESYAEPGGAHGDRKSVV